MQYIKKPVVIDAVQFTGTNYSEIREFINSEFEIKCNGIIIRTLEGDHLARPSDYIIKGVKGEFYPCREEIFNLTYDKVEIKQEGK